MLKKVLVANRGEIACRIISTARRMGMQTVAVYSEADQAAWHVRMADEAVAIGPPASAESYLSFERILDAAKRSGADCIHPGYGFLSENPAFVEAVEADGLTFVGPPAAAIQAMGLKDAAKALMSGAGVPVVPGYHGEQQEPAFLLAQAREIGFPVLIKARAGGGGKGMRLVESADSFNDALASARREAQQSFGDASCLIEKYVAQPRHIEIQVLADQHGQVVHLFERDCSLQRRHQKVIEEAPAPGMGEALRNAMGQAAVEAARAIGYQGAGTVEFIVDSSDGLREDRFWFMEMNTRLQVEHPVTEAISGLDLVEWQFRVASGQRLPFSQQELAIDGHAIEARIYAEDVGQGFLPATGTLEHLVLPDGERFRIAPVRIDSGVRQGDRISPWYDPMIAKLIVHGQDRQAALAMMEQALAGCRIVGSVTNTAFLAKLNRLPAFVSGHVHTGLIGEHVEELVSIEQPDAGILSFAAIVASGVLSAVAETHLSAGDPFVNLVGWRSWSHGDRLVHLAYDGQQYEYRVVLKEHVAAESAVKLAAIDTESEACRSIEIRLTEPCAADTVTARVTENSHSLDLQAFIAGTTLEIFDGSRRFSFSLPDIAHDVESGDSGDDTVSAPMPGLIRVVSAGSGQQVTKGEPLLVLEAMKMEHVLKAPRDGDIEEVLVAEGDQVELGAALVRLSGG